MSDPDFVKGMCRQCGGHLEFPAEAVGTTVVCPHCGKNTELNAAASPEAQSRRPMRFIFAVIIVAVVVGAALWIRHNSRPANVAATRTTPLIESNSPTRATNAPAIPLPKPEIVTNEFALFPFKLDKLQGSSLVYVTGTLQNVSDRQRFGVKLEFDLFDAQTNTAGKATDYQSVLDPHGAWHFKAMVISSKAVAAHFGAISEAQ